MLKKKKGKFNFLAKEERKELGKTTKASLANV